MKFGLRVELSIDRGEELAVYEGNRARDATGVTIRDGQTTTCRQQLSLNVVTAIIFCTRGEVNCAFETCTCEHAEAVTPKSNDDISK